MERFLNFRYFFTPLPNPNFQFTKLTLLIGILLMVSGFAFGIWRKRYLQDPIAKKILRKYPGRIEIYGLLVIMLLAFRELGIPYLSMRVWWLILLAFFLYNVLQITLTYKKEYQRRLGRENKNSDTQKYLPKKKR